jgi:hypothetical protein
MDHQIDALQRIGRIGLAAGATLCLLFSAAVSVRAQAVNSDQAPHLKPVPAFLKQPFQARLQNMPLEQILEMIRKTGGINIVVDGEPVRTKADFDLSGTLQDALDRVADTFDYNWTVTKSGVVLMTKRFKDPEEHPQANLPEMRQMAKDILDALSLATHDTDDQAWSKQLETLAHSFTPAQFQALHAGQRLHGSDLAPDQLSLLRQATWSTFTYPRQVWEELSAKLDAMPDSYIEAKKRSGPEAADGQPQYDCFHVERGRFGRWLITNLMHVTVQEGDKVIQ